MTTIPLRARRCSLCRNPAHNIRKCNDPIIENTIEALNTNVEEIVTNIELMRNTRFSQDTPITYINNQINIYMNNQLTEWIDNLDTKLLSAIYFKLLEYSCNQRQTLVQDLKVLYKRYINEVIRFRLIQSTPLLTRNQHDIPIFVVHYMSKKVVKIVNETMNINEMFGGILELSFFGNAINGHHIITIIEHIDTNDGLYKLTHSGKRIIQIIRRSIERLRNGELSIPNNKIQLIIHQESSQASDSNNTQNCPICYEDVNTVNILTTQCKHSFCKTCVVKLLKTRLHDERTPNCALCRENITCMSGCFSEIYEFMQENNVASYFS